MGRAWIKIKRRKTMNKTKKGLMYAGGILAIVFAAIMLILAIVIFCSLIDVDIKLILTEAEYASLTLNEINLLTDMGQSMITAMGVFISIVAVLDLVFGIRVILDAKHLRNRKHNIITLLVVNAISGSLLVVGFMIAALCLKFKSAEQIVDEVAKSNSLKQ